MGTGVAVGSGMGTGVVVGSGVGTGVAVGSGMGTGVVVGSGVGTGVVVGSGWSEHPASSMARSVTPDNQHRHELCHILLPIALR